MQLRAVAPFTGAWIEIEMLLGTKDTGTVAPFTGAWIEIKFEEPDGVKPWSLPSRERGLK